MINEDESRARNGDDLFYNLVYVEPLNFDT